MCYFQWCGNVHNHTWMQQSCAWEGLILQKKNWVLWSSTMWVCSFWTHDANSCWRMAKGAPTFWENLEREKTISCRLMTMASLLLLQRSSLMQVPLVSHRASTTHAPIHIILVKSFARSHSVLRWASSSVHAVLCLDAIVLMLEVISSKQLLYWMPWLEVTQKRTAVEIAALWYALIRREEHQLLEWVCKNGCEEVDMVIHISYFSPCNFLLVSFFLPLAMKALLPSTSSTSKSNLMHEPHCFGILQPILITAMRANKENPFDSRKGLGGGMLLTYHGA